LKKQLDRRLDGVFDARSSEYTRHATAAVCRWPRQLFRTIHTLSEILHRKRSLWTVVWHTDPQLL